LDGAVSGKSPAQVLRVVSDARKVDRISPLQLSKRDFRMVVRHHHHGIAIVAFKRSYAQVQSGRLDPDEHWGTAILARMKVNFVGREAKERVRGRHIVLLRFNCEVDPNRSWLRPSILPGPLDLCRNPRRLCRNPRRAQQQRRSGGSPLLRIERRLADAALSHLVMGGVTLR